MLSVKSAKLFEQCTVCENQSLAENRINVFLRPIEPRENAAYKSEILELVVLKQFSNCRKMHSFIVLHHSTLLFMLVMIDVIIMLIMLFMLAFANLVIIMINIDH